MCYTNSKLHPDYKNSNLGSWNAWVARLVSLVHASKIVGVQCLERGEPGLRGAWFRNLRRFDPAFSLRGSGRCRDREPLVSVCRAARLRRSVPCVRSRLLKFVTFLPHRQLLQCCAHDPPRLPRSRHKAASAANFSNYLRYGRIKPLQARCGAEKCFAARPGATIAPAGGGVAQLSPARWGGGTKV